MSICLVVLPGDLCEEPLVVFSQEWKVRLHCFRQDGKTAA
jgi:hypothetical protein